MKQFEVTWIGISQYRHSALVEAETEEEAIEKAKTGEVIDEEEIFDFGVETKKYKAVEVEE